MLSTHQTKVTMDNAETKFLSPSEFAERAGVHVETVYRRIRDGRLPHKKERRGFERHEYLIPESALPQPA